MAGGAAVEVLGPVDVEEERDRRAAARERTRRATASGDYDGLLAPGLWVLLDRAGGEDAPGFGREIGALRFAMARLLAEEEDPRQLAQHLSRLTTTLVRTAQAQRAEGQGDPVRAALLEALAAAGLGGDPGDPRGVTRGPVATGGDDTTGADDTTDRDDVEGGDDAW